MSSKRTRTIELLVNGGIDTKSNPKLVRSPSLLELENLYQLRTGELRPRNGASKLAAADAIGTGSNLFVTARGGLGSIARNWKGLTAYPTAVKYGNTSTTGWEAEGQIQSRTSTWYQHPVYTARVDGVTQSLYSGTNLANSIDPDMFTAGGWQITTWTDGTAVRYMNVRDSAGRPAAGLNGWGMASQTAAASTAFKCAAAGANQSAVVWVSAAGTLKAQGFTGTGSVATAEIVITAGLAASPFFDVKAIPGTGNVAIAFKLAAGGVTCGIFNPLTGAFSSSVNTAGADASFALAWMDDALATSGMYLVTAGSTSGVVVRTMSATTMVVSATNIIDGTATAGINNVTGHLRASSTDYVVLWDVLGASSRDDAIKQGVWTGAASVKSLAYGMSLYSRTALFPDGNYHVLSSVTSTVQPLYMLLPCDRPGVVGNIASVPPECVILSGEGGGRRLASSLASPSVGTASVVIPVIRNRKISTPTGDVIGGNFKTAALVTVTAQPKLKARELGGTVFIAGGVLHIDDGDVIQPATFPVYPEAPTGVSAAGGAMTSTGTYLYRIVWKAVDATGRITRSAGSTQLSITLGAADTQVTLTISPSVLNTRGAYMNSPGRGFGIIVGEVYRRGPTASGASVYNKVGETAAGPDAGPNTFVDQMSDTNAAAGEVAYFSGNVLENFNPPSCSLLEVNGNRVGIVNAESPTEFWYSKEYKAGAGIGFNPLNKIAISGDGAGDLTALGAMDGRWILFKRSAIYVLSGDGPNDLGQGSFNAPQAVSRNLGTVNPSSVVETPDGIMFEAPSGGIWLLGRGLGLEYVGSPVEQYTIAEDVAGAAPVSGLTTVRFVMPSGRMLEWDYFHKRWYTHKLRADSSGVASTVVDCANSALFGWCYLLANGDLMQEVAGQATDVNGTTTTIVPRVSFPHLELTGLTGYQRFRRLDLLLDVLGTFTLSVDAEFNYSGAVTGAPKTITLTAATPTVQVEYLPPDGSAKCTSVRPVITLSGPALGGSFRITGASIEIGIKSGSNIPASGRMS